MLLNRYIRSLETDVVLVDNVQGGYLATKHLIELGHSKIAHLSGPALSTAGQGRLEGYKKALREFDLEIRERDIVEGDLQMESGAGHLQGNGESIGSTDSSLCCKRYHGARVN